jgi:hypothetical protein
VVVQLRVERPVTLASVEVLTLHPVLDRTLHQVMVGYRYSTEFDGYELDELSP